MGHVDARLSTPLEGALAAGGDPATSPLYVFGPFLGLIVPAGVAAVTFGASIWLAVLTVAVVSVMYRLVMQWVTDGTGGTGLSEEEFGPWAGKVNASITIIEYTLTALVSLSALVTFVSDRIPALGQPVFGVSGRDLLAAGLAVLTAALVNRGPRRVSQVFGPATAGVLVLLWTMVAATVWQDGLRLPRIDPAAFGVEYAGFTFGGYARILALMTGIEVFANMVAAYDGTPRERGRKAFGSLLIVMVSTSVAMLIVGPAILSRADVSLVEVSVFTQTMDALLPGPLAMAGTVVGVLVLLSATAAALGGLQYLGLGLSKRGYLPETFGALNDAGVAARPVWLVAAALVVFFLLLGTHEETYLAVYAAGVFVLLSMTAWAALSRLLGEPRHRLALIVAVVLGALLTSGATALIFSERFFEGAWLYLVVVPGFYVVMSREAAQRTPPPRVAEEGRTIACSCGCLAVCGPSEPVAIGEPA